MPQLLHRFTKLPQKKVAMYCALFLATHVSRRPFTKDCMPSIW